MNKFILALTVGAGILGTARLSAAEAMHEDRRVTVQGHGKVSAPPDLARLRLEVVEEGPRVDLVTKDVRTKMEAVMKAIRSHGVAEKDMQTRSYQVLPKQEWRNNRSTRVGY